ncbi:DUF6461 domain-containing protein [Streptomyces sp. NPDC048643]|uniref:DUF6461 domain-containing protein n=1 Tax=Streptomyces sp. NPDC048643 TaxID=3155637 RepID=UPI00342D22BE
MNSATAHDYAWIHTSSAFGYALDVGYTLTLVRGVAPGAALAVMDAEPHGTCTGTEELIELQQTLFEETDYSGEACVAGAFSVPGEGGDWTLILQFDGGAGSWSRSLVPLSTGGRAVVHSTNGGKPIDLFHWYEDGELRTTFEWASSREGSTPDDLNSVLRELGFDLDEDETGTGTPIDTKAGVFALAERMTGVRVTEDQLRTAEYQVGHVPEEPAEEWTAIVIDITDANGGRLYKEVSRTDVETAMARSRIEAEAPMVVRGPSQSPPQPATQGPLPDQ